MSSISGSRRSIYLLAIGGSIGVVLAAAGIVTSARTAGGSLPPGVVARVNGQPIRAEEYERMVAALAGDRRGDLDDKQRQYVLNRLIDEELLVQRGLQLGYARVDRKVRSDLTAAVIAGIVAQADTVQPTDAELKAFYEKHRDFFTGTGRLRVRQVFCRVAKPADDAAAKKRATEAAERLRKGEDFAAVHEALGDRELAPLPDDLLPPAKLRDYLGPTALQVVLSMGEGDVSDPVRSGTGYHVLQVEAREAESTPPFDEIKPQVVEEVRRRAGDKALRAYLDDLRQRSNVVVSDKLP